MMPYSFNYSIMSRALVVVLVFLLFAFRPDAGKKKPVHVELGANGFFCTALINGKLWIWGETGILRMDTVKWYKEPRLLSKEMKFVSTANELSNIIAIDEKGVAWAWGQAKFDFSSVAQGKLKSQLPIRIFDSVPLKQVRYNGQGLAAITNEGKLLYTGRYPCFDGYSKRIPFAELLPGTRWNAVDMGTVHGTGISAEGRLYGWGDNIFGQLFVNGSGGRKCNTIQVIDGGNDWSFIDVSATNCTGIKKDGSLWQWGTPAFETQREIIPLTRLAGGPGKWMIVSTSDKHTVAIAQDGSLWAKGDNQSGQLGDGTNLSRKEFVRVGKDNDWVAIATSSAGFTIAAKKDGSIWTWGNNENFFLGDGTQNNCNYPARIRLK
jgi:alpha-tubulin suppressor-like RCC1 family protein